MISGSANSMTTSSVVSQLAPEVALKLYVPPVETSSVELVSPEIITPSLNHSNVALATERFVSKVMSVP